MKVLAALAVFAALAMLDLPALIREREWRELAVFSVVAAAAGVCIVCFALDIEMFSFLKAVTRFFDKTLRLNYELWQGHT